MAKTKKIIGDSTDFIAKEVETKEVLKKEFATQLIKDNLKIFLVLLGFFIIFLIGLILTIIGESNRPIPGDLGAINTYSTMTCFGIIFLLISSLSIVLIIPLTYRYFKKRVENNKSKKIVRNI